MSNWNRKLGIAISVLALVGFGFVLGSSVLPSLATGRKIELQVAAPNSQVITDEERIYADVYNRVGPSVVSINISSQSGADVFVPEGLGTGFVIDTQGDIVTNNHVVDGADRIEVNFFDGTITRGDVVGLDPDSDLAVVKVDLPQDRLHPVTFADSSTLFIGQKTLALGSPFGERWTLTAGIISALDRRIEGLSGYGIGAVIQTDAAINPGNSGGPLLNLQGEVIGVNSQIISRTRSNSGIGFAIPSNLVQRVALELIAKGRVAYSYLGISSQSEIDLSLMEQYNLPNNVRGVPVSDVYPGTPAALGGLQPWTNRSVDIIVAIDGQPVSGFNELIAYLAINTLPDQHVTLTVLRDGQYFDMPVTLTERP